MSSDTPISLEKDIPFILTVRVYVPPNLHAAFFALFNPAYARVITEPECRFFFVHRHLPTSPNYDPECISWVEGWGKDVDWMLNVQAKKDYYVPYLSETAKLYSEGRGMEMEFWRPEEGLCRVKMPVEAEG